MNAPLPYLKIDEMTVIFGYKNVRAAIRAIKNKKFPVATYKLAGKHVANITVINKFFDSKTSGSAPVEKEDLKFLED